MHNFIKYILFITISFIIPSSSYQGLLLPNNSYVLLNSDDSYLFKKNILLNNNIRYNISSCLISLPQDINIGAFTYNYNYNYNIQSSIMIVDYGKFIDSESEYTFSAKDFIINNKIFLQINNFLYSSTGIKYISSNIEQYKAHGLTMDFNLYYHINSLIISGFIKNYGFIINDYTNYSESLPQSHGLNLTYKPKHLNSIFLIQYQLFHDYNELNIYNELFIMKNFSLSIGYTSLANNLYDGNFNDDLLIGFGLGFTTNYKEFLLNIEIKNLGSVGLINSISISKSIN